MSAIEWIRGATEPVIPFTYVGVDITGWTVTLHIGSSPAVSKAAVLTAPLIGKAEVTFLATDFDGVASGTFDGQWTLDDGAGGILKVQGFAFILKDSVGA